MKGFENSNKKINIGLCINPNTSTSGRRNLFKDKSSIRKLFSIYLFKINRLFFALNWIIVNFFLIFKPLFKEFIYGIK